MNVTEIVRELKWPKKSLSPVAELGFDIGERAIKVDDTIAVRLIAAKSHRKLGQRKSLFHERKVEEVAEPIQAPKS